MTRRCVLGLLLVLAACGVKSSPLPPELVQPQAPSGLVAKSVPEGIRLTWRRPTSYTGGKHMRDLAGFEIERADGAEFAVAGTVTLTDQTRFQQERSITWTDTSAVSGETYRYRVVATTTDGYRSAPSEVVTLAHHPGATAETPATAPVAPPAKHRRAPH